MKRQSPPPEYYEEHYQNGSFPPMLTTSPGEAPPATPIHPPCDLDYDPWALPELQDEGVKWSELDTRGKIRRVIISICKVVALVTLLYFFVCSLDFLSSAFRLLGGKSAGRAFAENELLKNPIAGLMVGILATVLVQSSSTSTSIVVTMVASGLLHVQPAIPIIMGANIGTSVTNTIVSLAQVRQRDEFRRAFGGATVHDMFNWASVILLLPLEVASGYLYRLTGLIIASFKLEQNKDLKQDILKKVTKPFTSLIVQLDKKVITKIATGEQSAMNKSLIKEWCKYEDRVVLVPVMRLENVTVYESGMEIVRQQNTTRFIEDTVRVGVERCKFLFNGTGMADSAIGVILLIVALIILCVCLILIVKVLNSMFRGRVAAIVKKTINAEFPGNCSFLTGYVTILVGAGLTIIVQSSSIFTSALTPLVGMGVISLDRMYPLTLGANIGTTATAILASFANSGIKLQKSLQVALCHLFFNISGILLFYPIPFMRKIPISLAKKLGNTTARYRWFALLYLTVMFFCLPALVFALSIAGWQVLVGFGVPILLLIIAVVIINILQNKRPQWLPKKLQNWDFLPLWMHSLEPLDKLITKLLSICPCCSSEKDDSENKEAVSGQQEMTPAWPIWKPLPKKEEVYSIPSDTVCESMV